MRRFDSAGRGEHSHIPSGCTIRLAGATSSFCKVSSTRLSSHVLLLNVCRMQRKPTWGTCAGLILLAEAANKTKKGGQDLIGGLDVRVNRNHFGRQVESFQQNLELPFLGSTPDKSASSPFRCVFIRAPVVEKVLPPKEGIQTEEASKEETIVAPSQAPVDEFAKQEIGAPVEVLAKLSSHSHVQDKPTDHTSRDEDIIAVKQGNVFGTSFHPELTEDPRIHVWWLENVLKTIERRKQYDGR